MTAIPDFILTSYLGISSVWVKREEDNILLMGIYGCLVTGEIKNIIIETEFEILNSLLGKEEQMDESIEHLVYHLTDSAPVDDWVDVAEEGGLHFHDHIFSFHPIVEEDEFGYPVEQEGEYSFHLDGFAKREEMLPSFMEHEMPKNEIQLRQWLDKLWVARYYMYLHFRKITDSRSAAIQSGLAEGFQLTYAKILYYLAYPNEKESE